MEIKLNAEEAVILKETLTQLKIRKRTGELGILHGMDRFVSTHLTLRKQQLEALDSAAQKLGLDGGIGRTEK